MRNRPSNAEGMRPVERSEVGEGDDGVTLIKKCLAPRPTMTH